MFQLARKNHLARNISKMSKRFPEEDNFAPKTYLLPADWGDFKNCFTNNKKPVFIVKPEAAC